VIFRSLLFTIVVLEVFGLVFLLVKLLIIPVFHIILNRTRQLLAKSQITPPDDVAIVEMKNINPSIVNEQILVKRKPLRRWSTVAIARKVCHD
jgi:hypothetical protein